jgi:hypothetical protein
VIIDCGLMQKCVGGGGGILKFLENLQIIGEIEEGG